MAKKREPIPKESIQATERITYDVIYDWFINDVDSWGKPLKVVTKLKQIEKHLK